MDLIYFVDALLWKTNSKINEQPSNDERNLFSFGFKRIFLCQKSKSIDARKSLKSNEPLTDGFQRTIEQRENQITIVLFYADYCPYSQRAREDLRRWAETNSDRFVLDEFNVEKSKEFVEFYQIRSIPTVLAFDRNHSIVPIWRRTTDEIFSNENHVSDSSSRFSQLKCSINSSEEISYDWDKSLTQQKTYQGRLISLTSCQGEVSSFESEFLSSQPIFFSFFFF